MSDSNNKRVAKNAVALALRMVLVTVVGLYTSRIVLEVLGDIDYGIYAVVGGIVGMISFLNTSMASATTRFITYELGRENIAKLKGTFNNAFWIHFGIAIIVMLLAETVGLWFLNHKMVIPQAKMFEANILFQYSVFTVFVSFTQIPYLADIFAHERMKVYAYFEIANVISKLAIVFILLEVGKNKLIIYGTLIFVSQILIALSYRIYCKKNFKEARINFSIDKKIIKEMLTFTGYDLYGTLGTTAKSQGQPIVLNLFFGVLANTASALALTVSGAIKGFAFSISQAFRPQIIKSYASDNIEQMELHMRRAVQFSILIYSCLSLPFMLLTPQILYLWLGQIPEYAVNFLRLIIFANLLNTIVTINNTANHATGSIKSVSFINGTFYFLCPIVSYVLYRCGIGINATYIVDVVITAIIAVIGWIINKRQIPQFKTANYIIPVLKSMAAFIITLICMCLLKNNFHILNPDYLCESWGWVASSVVLMSILSAILSVLITYIIALNKDERVFLFKKISDACAKIKRF